MTPERAAETASAAAASVASKATYVGAAGSGLGWLTHSELLGLAGLLLAAGGFAVNAAVSWRRDRREAAEHRMRAREHAARMRALGDSQAEDLP